VHRILKILLLTPEDVFSVNTFDELQLDARMVKNLADLAITQLTTIQARALPVILGGKDALVKSQTGSGKTLTYAIPIMQVIIVLFLLSGVADPVSGIRCLFDPGIRDR
jgi:superfamily II DNA/RNA helicase